MSDYLMILSGRAKLSIVMASKRGRSVYRLHDYALVRSAADALYAVLNVPPFLICVQSDIRGVAVFCAITLNVFQLASESTVSVSKQEVSQRATEVLLT